MKWAYPICPRITTIGKTGCDIIIDNPTVDQQHAVIEYDPSNGLITLRDLSSRKKQSQHKRDILIKHLQNQLFQMNQLNRLFHYTDNSTSLYTPRNVSFMNNYTQTDHEQNVITSSSSPSSNRSLYPTQQQPRQEQDNNMDPFEYDLKYKTSELHNHSLQDELDKMKLDHHKLLQDVENKLVAENKLRKELEEMQFERLRTRIMRIVFAVISETQFNTKKTLESSSNKKVTINSESNTQSMDDNNHELSNAKSPPPPPSSSIDNVDSYQDINHNEQLLDRIQFLADDYKRLQYELQINNSIDNQMKQQNKTIENELNEFIHVYIEAQKYKTSELHNHSLQDELDKMKLDHHKLLQDVENKLVAENKLRKELEEMQFERLRTRIMRIVFAVISETQFNTKKTLESSSNKKVTINSESNTQSMDDNNHELSNAKSPPPPPSSSSSSSSIDNVDSYQDINHNEQLLDRIQFLADDYKRLQYELQINNSIDNQMKQQNKTIENELNEFIHVYIEAQQNMKDTPRFRSSLRLKQDIELLAAYVPASEILKRLQRILLDDLQDQVNTQQRLEDCVQEAVGTIQSQNTDMLHIINRPDDLVNTIRHLAELTTIMIQQKTDLLKQIKMNEMEHQEELLKTKSLIQNEWKMLMDDKIAKLNYESNSPFISLN
ncbi:uncharacterized protein DC041_0004902 [Schistosoma bovis]|uniref:FHA domain-containing protein n=1 Tax=Schistosoma bovis TaxID=6184 RepID=A0A430QLH8_SCHBO|nr:uncharacterized protein DC041_0004902 [Schistosoma bovis]